VRFCTIMYNIPMSTISASEARQTLPAQLDRVEAGEEVAITRHGRVVAVLVSPETLNLRRIPAFQQRADEIAQRLEAARSLPLKRASMAPGRADELIAWIRESREAR